MFAGAFNGSGGNGQPQFKIGRILHIRLVVDKVGGRLIHRFALGSLDRDLMVRALGLTIVAISLWNLRAPNLQRGEAPLWDGVTGLVGGLLGGAFNTGGPAIVAHLYRRADPPQALKATNQLIFFTMGLARLPTAPLIPFPRSSARMRRRSASSASRSCP